MQGQSGMVHLKQCTTETYNGEYFQTSLILNEPNSFQDFR